MGMWATLRRLRLAHIPTAPTTTALVPTHRQPEAFSNCKWQHRSPHRSCGLIDEGSMKLDSGENE